MSKKLNIEFIREQFEKEGYILLTKEYINSEQKLEYICPEQHEWHISWDHWKQGTRCAECAGCKKLTIEFVREQFEKEGYTLLSKEYKNNKSKLKYICPKDHCWDITWSDWSYGYRCAECGGTKKLTIEYIRKQFEEEGYVLLTKEYINCDQKLEYVCPKLHERSITWAGWRRGNRCFRCRYNNMYGENHPRWNKNLTEEERDNRDEKRRYVQGYNEWKYLVKERDNFTCQVCGQSRGSIVSHHLYSYRSWPELRIELDNGVCLCEKCHKAFHYKYGYGNNTKEQFEEFKCVLWHTFCIYTGMFGGGYGYA